MVFLFHGKTTAQLLVSLPHKIAKLQVSVILRLIAGIFIAYETFDVLV